MHQFLGKVTDLALPGGGNIVKTISETIGNTLEEETNLDEKHRELVKLLEQQKQRFLIIVDDIDRMLPEETFLIFKLIKTVGHLPYFTYLLAYDRSKVEQIFENHEQIQDKTYLEKFIQASFDVPHITPSLIKLQVYQKFRKFIKDPSVLTTNQFKSRYRNLISPLIQTPRDVTRVCNVLNITWRAVERQLNFADFVAIETLRVLQPELYHTIKSCKEDIFKIWEQDQTKGFKFKMKIEDELNKLKLEEPEKSAFARGLYDLFSANTAYNAHGGDIALNYNVEKFKQIHHLIGSASWFDYYFQFSSDEISVNRPTQYLLEDIENNEQVKFRLKKIIDGFEQSGNDDNEQLLDFFDEVSDVCLEIPVENLKIVLSVLISEYKHIRNIIEGDYRGDKLRTTFINYYWPIIQQMRMHDTQKELNVIEAEKLNTILNCVGEANFEFVFDFAHFVYQKSKKQEDASELKSSLQILYDESNRQTLYRYVGELVENLDLCGDSIDSDYLRDMLLFVDVFLGNESFDLARAKFKQNMASDQFLVKFLEAFSINVERIADSDFDDDEIKIEWEYIRIFVELDGVTDRLQRLLEQEGLEPEIKLIAEKVLRGRDA